MFCGKCGSQIKGDASFCGSCGASVEKNQVSPVAKNPVSNGSGFDLLVQQDTRFNRVKVFNKFIMTPIAVSENGYVGIYQEAHRKQIQSSSFLKSLIPSFEDIPETLIVLHISQINGFELIVDNKSGLGGAIAGGLLFGSGGAVVGQAISSGKAKSIDLLIKTNDFQNPQIIVSLYRIENSALDPWAPIIRSVKSAVTGSVKQREAEIQELLSLLENLLQNAEQSAVPIIQQASDADELLKFKNLLDNGIISQEEFDAKKKQILGL